MTTMLEEIKDEFAQINAPIESDDVAEMCVQLCHQFGLSGSDFVAKYDEYTMKKNESTNPTKASLTTFSSELKQSVREAQTPMVSTPTFSSRRTASGAGLARELVQSFGIQNESVVKALEESEKKAVTAKRRTGLPGDSARKRGLGTFGAFTPTPEKSGRSPASSTSPLSSSLSPPSSASKSLSPASASYAARTKSGEAEVIFDPENRGSTQMFVTAPEVNVKVFETTLRKPYRFMFEKLHERAEILDARIEETAEIILSKHKAELLKSDDPLAERGELNFSDVTLASQEPVLVAGRVCLNAVEGRLNNHSIILEGSQETSHGHRVPVDLSQMDECSLFAGQTIVAEGKNPNGTSFTPTKIYEGAMPRFKKTKPQEIEAIYYGNKDSTTPDDLTGVHMMMAAGPFTTTQNLDFEPLRDFLSLVSKRSPQVVILTGPFVDANNQRIKDGQVDSTYEELHEEVMREIILAVTELSTTKLIIIPSLSDVAHDFIYPQPPFERPAVMDDISEDAQDRVFFFANPSMFMINEMTIGVTSLDTMMDLSKNETSKNKTGDRMTRLVSHILQQRSFYPVDPPSANVNLDYAHIEHTQMQYRPDILICPSKLKKFAKDIGGTLAVNPGYLTRNTTGGNYAQVTVFAPLKADIPETTKGVSAGVGGRAVCKIIRI